MSKEEKNDASSKDATTTTKKKTLFELEIALIQQELRVFKILQNLWNSRLLSSGDGRAQASWDAAVWNLIPRVAMWLLGLTIPLAAGFLGLFLAYKANTLLSDQNGLLRDQNKLVSNQGQLVTSQNEIMRRQLDTADLERRASYVGLLGATLRKIQQDIDNGSVAIDPNRDGIRLSPATEGEVILLSALLHDLQDKDMPNQQLVHVSFGDSQAA